MIYKSRYFPHEYGKIGHNNGAMSSASMLNGMYWTTSGERHANFSTDALFKAWAESHFNDMNYYNPLLSGSSSQVFGSTKRKKPIFNDCHNTIVRDLALGFSYDAARIGRNYGYKQLMYLSSRAFETYKCANSGVDVALVQHRGLENRNAASKRAWWSMQPRYEGKVSMLNFLFELKDFRDIVKYVMKPSKLPRIIASARNFARKVRKDARSGASALDPTLPASQVWLTNEFAIKPLVSDVMAILTQLVTIVDDTQGMFAYEGQELSSSHYKELLSSESNLTIGTSTSRYHEYAEGWREETYFNATMEYKYKYKVRSTHDAFLRYWGLTMSAEAFWNMIPGSFLVDYFIKIGDSLRFMNLDNNVTLNLSQYCESLSTELGAGKFVGKRSDIWSKLLIDGESVDHSNLTFINGQVGTVYNRVLTLPNRGPVSPRLTAPTKGALANMLALARCFLS